MSDNPNANFDDRLDTATARRLGRLGTMPVDTTRLESRLCDELGLASSAPTAADAARRGRVYAIVHSARAIAAMLAEIARGRGAPGMGAGGRPVDGSGRSL